ncbi:hypothetical protein TNCT_524431 [Trichonephila clavata]|uniref:Uncharacterized protein n=1 Tax=Trichonephila clavata TaxID=2740835 RepID=A0A8X6LC44_TRICU|nr:hypothetical protein TNCT_524431 [Trichonephila clavata]
MPVPLHYGRVRAKITYYSRWEASCRRESNNCRKPTRNPSSSEKRLDRGAPETTEMQGHECNVEFEMKAIRSKEIG